MNATIRKQGERYGLVYDEIYATDPDDLWQAVTDPSRLARWMALFTGDLRLGGTWEVASDDDPATAWCRGTVTACDAPHSFTTTWQATGEDATDLVVRLEPAPGGTRLVLEHAGIQSIFYGAGWQTYLERLAHDLAGREVGGEDAWQARFAQLKPEWSARFAAH